MADAAMSPNRVRPSIALPHPPPTLSCSSQELLQSQLVRSAPIPGVKINQIRTVAVYHLQTLAAQQALRRTKLRHPIRRRSALRDRQRLRRCRPLPESEAQRRKSNVDLLSD